MLHPHWPLLARRRLLAAGTSAAALTACTPAQLLDAILPEPPPYPDFRDRAAVDREARRISDALLLHVAAWLDGRGPAAVPSALLPDGTPTDLRTVRCVRPEEVRPEEIWIVRPAEERLDFQALRGLYPDPHCTYLVPGIFLVPFGCTATVEGEFPRARFFSVQATPPFDPTAYYYDGAFGAPEVPIADVDIDPLPGHTNPFRPGADRTAARRSYQVRFEMRQGGGQGSGPGLEPAYRPPHWRAPGNRRLGGGITYQGPLARPGTPTGHGRGVWGPGALWIRYYAPDLPAGPLGGVLLPRLSYALPDGRRFLLLADKRAAEARLNRTYPARVIGPREPTALGERAGFGWFRDLDIYHNGVVGLWTGTGKTSAADKARGRALVLGVTGHGAEQPAPGWYANSASRAAHITYLSRGMALGQGMVCVLTGRMPAHPRTRDGQARMGTGQVRYLSLTTYPEPNLFNLASIGIPHSSVMDEEIGRDAAGRYVVAYSRAADRPRNATAANGATWVDWGPAAVGGWTLRWLTVHPDWKDRRITPDDATVPYDRASWLSERWDPSLVSRNDVSGPMGEYKPRVHYLSRAAFEALGDGPLAGRVPAWT